MQEIKIEFDNGKEKITINNVDNSKLVRASALLVKQTAKLIDSSESKVMLEMLRIFQNEI